MGSITNGLVAYYPMHGDATGAIGSGMGGVLTGSPQAATNRFGEPMQAMAFKGGMDGLMLTNLNVNLAANGQNTVCFWLNWQGETSGTTNPIAMPFGWGGADQTYCLLFQTAEAGRFGFSMGMGDIYGVSSAMMTTNSWMHVAAVFENGSTAGSQLYINGMAMASMMSKSGMPMGMGPSGSASKMAFIGGSAGQSTNGYPFFGMMSDFRVFDRALSPAEIQGIYKQEAGPQLMLRPGTEGGTSTMSVSSMMSGWKFQMQSSGDLIHWTNQVGIVMPGNGGAASFAVTLGAPAMFWRMLGNP